MQRQCPVLPSGFWAERARYEVEPAPRFEPQSSTPGIRLRIEVTGYFPMPDPAAPAADQEPFYFRHVGQVLSGVYPFGEAELLEYLRTGYARNGGLRRLEQAMPWLSRGAISLDTARTIASEFPATRGFLVPYISPQADAARYREELEVAATGDS